MKRVLGGIAALAAGLYVTATLLLYFAQTSFIFPAPVLERAELDRAAAAAGAEPIEVTTADGVALYGWHHRAAGERAVLYFHGNGSHAGANGDLYAWLARQGWDAICVSYRGYPGSDGAPSEKGLAEDALATWRFATDTLAIPAGSVVLHGRSLGGGVASALAEATSPGGLILESTFTSITDMASASYPIFPTRLLLRHRFETRRRAPDLTLPVLILHGDADDVIPVTHGRALSGLFPNARYVEVPGADHNTWQPSATPVGRAAYLEFLEARRQ